jgi:hypothetical protein
MIITLDLHTLRQQPFLTMQEVVESHLDHAISPLLRRKTSITLHLIVGRGLNSTRLICGVHPLRYYTESYLKKLGISYKIGDVSLGQDGVIVAQL